MATKTTPKSAPVKQKESQLKELERAVKHLRFSEPILSDAAIAEDKEAFSRFMESDFAPAFGKVITRRSGW